MFLRLTKEYSLYRIIEFIHLYIIQLSKFSYWKEFELYIAFKSLRHTLPKFT